MSNAGQARIYRNALTGNTSDNQGAGLWILDTTTVDVTHNEFCLNDAVAQGGGVFQEGGSNVYYGNNIFQSNNSSIRCRMNASDSSDSPFM